MVRPQEPPRTRAYRHFMFEADSPRVERLTEFGGATRRVLRLDISALWDGQAGAVCARDLRLVEGVDDKGRALEVAPRLVKERPAAYEDVFGNCADSGYDGTLDLKPLEQNATGIAVLRGSLAVVVATKTTAFTLAYSPEKAVVGGHGCVGAVLSERLSGGRVLTVQLRPKGDLEAFRKMPVAFTVKSKEGGSFLTYAHGLEADGTVTYRIGMAPRPSRWPSRGA